MTDLSEYEAVVSQAVDEMLGHDPVLRALVDAEVEAWHAVQEQRWADEAKLMERARQKAEPMGEAFAEAFRIAARETGRGGQVSVGTAV